jgi:hypothetical protein
LAQLFWLIDLGLIVLILLSTFQPFGARWSHLLQPNFRWHWKGAWLAILPLTLAISLAIFPSHIFNPYIIPTLLGRLITMDGSADFLATMLASAKLYFGLILVKLGLPFGILTYAALALLVKKSIYQKRFLLIALILLFYGCLLAILPLQQPFWLMSVYSLILLSLSAMIVFGFRHRSNRTWTLAWSGLIGLAVVWLGFGLFQVYPVYGYYGYETIGDQWLGTNSKGYRAVVVVTNDGSVEAIDWLRQNASPGSRVLSYLDDTHIINYLEENQKLNFELKQAPKLAENVQQLDQVLKQADFVVFNVINNVDLAPPTSAPAFIQQFGTKPIYQIFRGRGIYRLSIIQIYQRIASTERSI